MTPAQQDKLLAVLKARFPKKMHRHQGIADVQAQSYYAARGFRGCLTV